MSETQQELNVRLREHWYKELQAVRAELAAEREARLKEFEIATGMVAAANAARLRAEVGAAELREYATAKVHEFGDPKLFRYRSQHEIAAKIASTDTGSRLAELLGEWRGMGCTCPLGGPTGEDFPLSESEWCLVCRLHEAMGWIANPTE